VFPPLAASLGANLILGLYLLVATAGIVFGYFTIRGSGINNHPCDGYHAPPGARLPDEFHQFADRQIHQADMRRAQIEWEVEARLARKYGVAVESPRVAVESPLSDDMSLDEVNRRLAAEAAARKAATPQDRERAETR
jgi:hypothetical protein